MKTEITIRLAKDNADIQAIIESLTEASDFDLRMQVMGGAVFTTSMSFMEALEFLQDECFIDSDFENLEFKPLA